MNFNFFHEYCDTHLPLSPQQSVCSSLSLFALDHCHTWSSRLHLPQDSTQSQTTDPDSDQTVVLNRSNLMLTVIRGRDTSRMTLETQCIYDKKNLAFIMLINQKTFSKNCYIDLSFFMVCVAKVFSWSVIWLKIFCHCDSICIASKLSP